VAGAFGCNNEISGFYGMWNVHNVLTSPEPVSVSRRTLLFGVSWVKWLSDRA
jgi:hypothetical protein